MLAGLRLGRSGGCRLDEDCTLINELIDAARPDVLIKGADYSVEGVVGHELVQSYGGEVKLAALVDGYSTTEAIRRMTAVK